MVAMTPDLDILRWALESGALTHPTVRAAALRVMRADAQATINGVPAVDVAAMVLERMR